MTSDNYVIFLTHTRVHLTRQGFQINFFAQKSLS
jgi:hypothetical protein